MNDVTVTGGPFQSHKLLLVASSRSPAGNRLGLDDWIQADYVLIAEEGIKALEIDRLCDRLGVTEPPSGAIDR